MATFRTTSITATAEKRSSNPISLASFVSLASFETGSGSSTRSESPIIVTTTVSTTTATYPMTVPPPFATSLGSDERLPRPRRGAPPVAPAKNSAERKQQRQGGVVRTLQRAVGLKRSQVDPALCEEW